MKIIARYLPTLLWLAVIVWAIRGGLSIPRSTAAYGPMLSPSMSIVFVGLGVVFAFLLRSQEPRHVAFFEWLADVFNEPEMASLQSRIHFPLLAATFFALGGGVSTIGCVWVGSTTSNLSFSLMPLAVGIGMFLGLAVKRLGSSSRSA